MQAPETQVVSTEELARLPQMALATLAVRAAWRVQVFDAADLDVDQRMAKATILILVQRMARGLPIDDIPLLSLEPAQTQEPDPLIQGVWGAALHPEPLRFCADALALAAERFTDVNAQLVKQAPTVSTSINVCDQAARADFDWLADWSTEKRAADGLVPSQFFDRPLWQRPEGDEPPFPVMDYFGIWSDASYKLGLDPLVDAYQAMLHGRAVRKFDDDLEQLVARWWADYQPRLHRQKLGEESQSAPETAQQPESQTKAQESPSGTEAPGREASDSDEESGRKASPPLLTGVVNTAADRPADEDHLGRGPLIETLADMLSYPGQALPMTIALLGDWGSGKSTVIHQLKASLERIGEQERALDERPTGGQRKPRARYLVAEFNAWEYEQTDSMRAGLAQEVVNGLTAGLSRWQKLGLALRRARKSQTLEFWQTLGALALAGLGAWIGLDLTSPDQVQKAMEGSQLARGLGGTGFIGLSAYLFFNAWRSGKRLLEHPMASQLNTYLKLPSYGKHLGEVPVIKRELETLCEMRLHDFDGGQGWGRLLVIVDDLDRCRPQAITETFDAIRLVMNMKNVAVIVAIDDRIAFRAVADHYRKLAEGSNRTGEEIARDYLSKIIQLPVNLYRPWHWEIREFVQQALFADAHEPEPDAGPEAVDQSGANAEITDAALQLARDNGVDIAQLHGSGKDGRIVKGDVTAYLAAGATPAAGQASETEHGATAPQPDVFPPKPAEPDVEVSTDQAQQQAERVYELMQDMAFERDLFAELTRDLQFHNPRQLIRLKNSYSLLKGYRHNRLTRGVPDRHLGERLMHGLFWYEYLYQCDLEHRRRAELVVWFWSEQPDWRERVAQSEPPERLSPALLMAARWERLHGLATYRRDYLEIMKTVEMAILPNAQMGLIQDAAEAERLWVSSEGATDPFG